MTEPTDPNTRAQVAALVKQNLGAIMRNLNSFWHRQAEDMIAGGVPKADVAESMLTVGITYGVTAMGAPALIAHLRAVADLFEQIHGDDPQLAKKSGRPH